MNLVKTKKSKNRLQETIDKVPVDWSARPKVDYSKLNTGIFKHQSIQEQRALGRISERELGVIKTFIKSNYHADWQAVKLWDFSSLGFGILIAPEMVKHIDAINVGQALQVQIKTADKQDVQVWCEVKNISSRKDGFKIGLRRQDLNDPRPMSPERREHPRLPMGAQLSLHARFKHPLLLGNWCNLQVADINPHMGFSFLSKDPSTFVFVGMEFELYFEIANFRNLAYTGRISWVSAFRENEVKFGSQCLNINYHLHNGICDLLLFSQQWTPAQLRACGFRAKLVKEHLRFRTVKSNEDYAQVLHLRRNAYVQAGKKNESTTAEEMASSLDGKSRILMAWHRDELVGSMTFAFPTTEDTLLDSQKGFEGQKYPVALPPKSNLIEVSRLCIHRDYRGTDLLTGIFEHGLKYFLLSDRHWLLTSAVNELLPLYEKIGFYKLGASYKHPALNNLEHHLIICHRSAFLTGKGISVFTWNALFGDLMQYLVQRNLLPLSWWGKKWIHLCLLLKPICDTLTSKKYIMEFNRHIERIRHHAN